MKTGWVTKRLGEVCEIAMGASPDSSSYNMEGRGLPFFQGKAEFGEKYPTPVKWCDHPVRCAGAGDILFSVRAPIGPTNFALEKSCIGRGLAALRFSGEQEYLAYFLKAHEQDLDALGTGTTFKCISGSALKSFEIPVPPLAEQKRIVAKIDAAFEKIDRLKANAERNLANAKELFQSALNEAMRPKPGWVEKRLGEVCTEFGRGKSKHRPRNDKRLYGGPYPFVQTGDVRNADHNIDKFSQTYSELGLSQSKLWPKGTLCITIAANIAETAILGFDACFPDSVIGCVFDESQMHTGFAEYMLQNYKCQLQSLGKDRSSAQPNINLGTFENNPFPVPPIGVQRQIVKRLDLLAEKNKSLEQHYTRLIADCVEMRQAVLKEAFEGRL